MKPAETIIRTFILSEKSTRGIETANQYGFKVDPAANKREIKKAVEELFKVHVVKVNTLHRKGKQKRQRTQKYGWTTGYKKAIVTLQAGNKIELV
ncbi:MAG: 50S ribosomal protein L23 [Verrucomicrobia bacterium]|nr:50S ribosomal protein L23 [Verrucomicrobiota bacterium]MCG2679013.1 50S ribosomal protein L23 [Kiritimatiellia bacterium]MBU4248365.1 50S ribosomal protein L23 [Verrucomicrobiota bacterium]MBU4289750.1 50S ribosomal protein L23 [Verrucomicrobiota bacterium]MBU4428536.1 50S ribosomal protein L23 [Verrucomicrobiota bacterium]